MADFDQIERTRERNEEFAYERHVRRSTPANRDTDGLFAVITTECDESGENPVETRTLWTSLHRALEKRDERQLELKTKGLGPARAEVTVVDVGDPSRGTLDWGDLG